MYNVMFEGREYEDSPPDSQREMHEFNIHTFRYFIKDNLWMASDMCADYFNMKKFFKGGYTEVQNMMIYPPDHEKHANLYKRILDGEKYASENLRSADGECWYRTSLHVLKSDEDGRPSIVGGFVEDYDEHLSFIDDMKKLSDDFNAVYMVDFDKDLIQPRKISEYINSEYGPQLESNPRYTMLMSRYIDKEVLEEEKAKMYRVTSIEYLSSKLKKSYVFRHDFRVMRYGLPIYIRMKVVRASEGDSTKAIIGFRDIDLEKREEWVRLAYYDLVTGGYNYNYFSERLKRQTRNGFVAVLDIHSFKIINSVCGIAMGDNVLRQVNILLQRIMKDSGFYGHINADCFIIFVDKVDESGVINLLNKITEEFRKLSMGDIPKLSPYFGITSWKPGNRLQLTFGEANSAKERIKSSLDVNYAFYREDDIQAAIEEKRIEDSFENALKDEQFEVWYQPKYDTTGEKIMGAEALVRWRKEDGSLMAPNLFIPIFEKNGMIKQLDSYVFNKVCSSQKKWNKEFGYTVPVTVNLSRSSLYYDNLVDDYRQIIESTGIRPDMVPLEITETAAVDGNSISHMTKGFYKAGFRLQIDDFGKGYSSLSVINMAEFDTIKLDKSLIDYIGEKRGDSLIKHTVALAKDLGISVTAEGVETEEQVRFLASIDCDCIQGYYFSKPIPEESFVAMLSDGSGMGAAYVN